MRDVTVVIPTTKGRELTCEQTVAEYKAQGAEVLVVNGASTCGEGWAAGLAQAQGDFVLLGVDDAVPHPGAVQSGVRVADQGIYPSPRIVKANGALESCGSLGIGGCHLSECDTGTPAYMSSLPLASREMWKRIGEVLPIHYYVDDYLGFRARCVGLSCEVVRSYAFTHYEEEHGRHRVVARAMEDRARFIAAAGASVAPGIEMSLPPQMAMP